VYERALEQVRVADALGFETVWAGRAPLPREYSHCSAPELFLTACAMQTTRIRVGHGAVVCVPAMNHPVRVAERAAVLDILSGGRLELGTARSSTWTELGGFEIDPDTTKKTWDEYVRVLPKMWTQERFGWDGVSFSMPERSILPKPIQQAASAALGDGHEPGDGARRRRSRARLPRRRRGGFAEQERRTREYHRRIRSCTPVSSVVNDRVATLNFLYCHEDARVAAATGLRMLGLFSFFNANLLPTREAFPTRAYQSLAALAPPPSSERGGPGDARAIPEGIAIGDPKRITEAIARWESIGVDAINFIMNAVETIPQDEVLASLRLFAAEVMPRFRKG
jgi:alkanesulfonate monooxygenase SsuD/methylene tetrahydromethanopterin reductase-like flavin-dependent oxidoreductase (luciferase family)